MVSDCLVWCLKMNLVGLYLSKLDTNISDLQKQLEDVNKKKDEESSQLKTDLEVLQVKNEENEDMVKVKQRYIHSIEHSKGNQ